MSYYETERDERVISALKEISSQLVNIKKAIESTDAVSVVRCKDCKHYKKINCDDVEPNTCEITTRRQRPYDYCSYGEGKD